MRINHTKFIHGALFLAFAFLTACNGGGGGGGGTPPATTYTIGGTVTGLTGTGLVLQNNGGGDLAISANGNFAFATTQASGSTYQVIVLTHPSGQTCTVSSSSGTVSAANVNTVAVTCTTSTNTFTIGGTVTGLTGAGLVLQNNGGDNLSISANGTFVFATPQANSTAYSVTVLPPQPAGQTCAVTAGIGVASGANVTTVSVTCSANTYTIGGTISGLTASGLVLLNNGGDTLTVSSGATSFTFNTAIASGATYNVTIQTPQPTGETCTVNSASGPVTSANITSVSVICSTTSYAIGGTVSGLTGSGLVLQNNGADDLTVAASPYNFATKLASGSAYNVTVKTQPTAPPQVCTVANSSGNVATADVANANVTCVSSYTIGGTITGAAAGIGPVLQNNLGDNLFIPAITTGTTSFTFSTPITDLTPYSVTQLIRARAPYQNCGGINITGGSGTVAGSKVTTVSITCAISTVVPKFAYVTNSTANPASGASAYTIGGTGALTAAATTASGDTPYAVAVDPTGQFAYVVNLNAHTISAYGINATSGVLTAIDADAVTPGNQASIATGNSPISIAVHPLGKFVYVANKGSTLSNGNTLSAYSINMTSGALSTIDADAVTAGTQPTIATGTNPYAVTVDSLGKFVYVANYTSNDVSAYTVDQTTGALTPVGAAVAAGTGPSSIATDPTGKCALVANNTSESVMSYTINQTTGALTLVSTVPGAVGSAPRSIAVDPNTGQFAYVANAGSGSVSAFSVNSSTCVIASIDTDAVKGGVQASIAAGSAPLSINVDPSGKFVYVANYSSNNISVFSIGVSGELTLVQTLTTGSGPTSVTTTQ